MNAMKAIVCAMGCALALSPLTSTRFMQGFGGTDIFLAACIVMLIIVCLFSKARASKIRAHGSITSGNALALQFWFVALPVLIFSSLVGMSIQGSDFMTTVIQFLPFLLASALVFSLFLAFEFDDNVHTLLGSFVFSSLLLSMFYWYMIATSQPEYFFYNRFVGLSENPNQIALQSISSASVIFLYVLFYPNKSLPVKIGSFCALFLTLFYGYESASDAMIISLIMTIFIYGAVVVVRIFHSHKLFAHFLLLLATLLVWYFYTEISDSATALISVADERKSEGNQDGIRYILWYNGIMAGLESPIWGNGAGAWSGLDSPFGGFESHNTIIDWFSMTGALGLIAWFSFIIRFILRFRFSNVEANICFFSLMVFSFFHLVLRHPVFWLAIMVCLASSGLKNYGNRNNRTPIYDGLRRLAV